MSDQSEGPGWWIASDGKWYAPELHPNYVPPLPPPPAPPAAQAPVLPFDEPTIQQPVASAAGTAASGAATPPRQRSWRKIGLIVGGVFVALLVIGALAGDPDKDEDDTATVASDAVTTTRRPTTTEASTTTLPSTTTKATTPTTTPATAPKSQPPSSSGETLSQKNARQKAADYLDLTGFSRSGLIKQLEYEGFNEADATYGTDAQHADWNEQAARKGAEYLEISSFSHDGLVDQLEYEGFTHEQAEYGASANGL